MTTLTKYEALVAKYQDLLITADPLTTDITDIRERLAHAKDAVALEALFPDVVDQLSSYGWFYIW